MANQLCHRCLAPLRAPSSLRPFTIKVLLDAFYDDTEQYPFVIDGMAVSSVELLGMVTNKTISMDHCTFDLYDGTGAVNVIYWFEGPQDSKDAWSFSNGMYVRVVGRTTSMEQFFQIKAYIVRPINNFNDVTHHFIYCIYAHIDISRQARLQHQQSCQKIISFQDRFRNILTFSKRYFQSCATQLTVHLPISARSCFDYSVSVNDSGILSLVNFCEQSLNTWLLKLVDGQLRVELLFKIRFSAGFF
ncbi:replication protein a 32 kda subunit b [Hordeum vulgare]|nr:replication protein a 32 kda subunit b [Hordeum vulgare]